ncbi:MAG: hypothetical protein AABY18_01060 [Candidatus Thermoplasmatota archaeon]
MRRILDASKVAPEPPAPAPTARATGPSVLLTIAIAFQLVAGILHLVLTPSHLSEALGTGLFFATIGASQTLWAVAALRTPFRWYRESGIALAIIPLALYAVTRSFRNPFTGESEGIDAIGFITDAAELVTALVLGGALLSTRGTGAVGPSVGRMVVSILLGVALAGALYGVGFAAAEVFPGLGAGAAGHHESAEVPMDHHASDDNGSLASSSRKTRSDSSWSSTCRTSCSWMRQTSAN